MDFWGEFIKNIETLTVWVNFTKSNSPVWYRSICDISDCWHCWINTWSQGCLPPRPRGLRRAPGAVCECSLTLRTPRAKWTVKGMNPPGLMLKPLVMRAIHLMFPAMRIRWCPEHGRWAKVGSTLQWHHNGCDCVSNHQPRDCLLNRLFRLRSKKTSKLRVTGLSAGNSPEPWISRTNGQ